MTLLGRRTGWLLALGGLLSAGLLLARLDHRIEEGFRQLGSAPSRIYTRPFVLHRGLDPVEAGLGTHLGRVGYRLVAGPRVRPGEFAVRADRWIVGVRAFRHSRGQEPGGQFIAQLDAEGRIADLRDADGHRQERVRLEPAEIGVFLGPDQRDRLPIRLSDVPPHLIDAVLVTEDRRFYDHSGIDPRRMVGAALANLRGGRVVEGASTITQQLVRSVYLTRERTLWRKVKEITIALLVELRHTKHEILEAYLNEIYLAQRGGVAIHGFALAAKHYLGKRIEDLSLAESALLAGIVRAPIPYSPTRDPEAARQRRDLVLRLLREAGRIDEKEYERSVASPLFLRPVLPPVWSAAYMVDFVQRRLAVRYGSSALASDGLAIHTTLDLRLQALAEEIVRKRLAQVESQFLFVRRKDSPLQAAVAVLEPRTGQLLALVGGRDYQQSPFNRAVLGRRQPGSIFKPIVALAALTQPTEGGDRFTLASILSDDPYRVRGRRGPWSPSNIDGRFRGEVTLREALEQSLNVPMINLAEAVGLGNVIATARRLGIESPLQPVLSLPLGTFEVSPLEITRSYGVLAAQGSRAPLRAVLGILDRRGRPLIAVEVQPLQVYEPAEVHLVTSALQGAADRGTAAHARRHGYHGALAAKTGSTNDFRDAWFIGYTPEVVIGVWSGFDDNRWVGLPGSALALPIGADLLIGALGPRGAAHFRAPLGVERHRVTIDRRGICHSVEEVFLRGTAPVGGCEADRDTGTDFAVSPRG